MMQQEWQPNGSIQHRPSAKSPYVSVSPVRRNALGVCENRSTMRLRQTPWGQLDLRRSTVEHHWTVQRLILLCCTAPAGRSGNNQASVRIQRRRMPASPQKTGLSAKSSG